MAFQPQLLPQFAMGGIETVFNALLARSPHLAPILRKLVGKILHIQLTQPNWQAFIVFSEQRTDWLNAYDGEPDCAVQLTATTLPKLADKSKLTGLINDKRLILKGDLQTLQHFTALLEQLESDPAEWLSHLMGDIPAQITTDFAQAVLGKVKHQFTANTQNLVENLMNERPVLVHRLEAVHFYDQVEQLAKQAVALEQKFATLGVK